LLEIYRDAVFFKLSWIDQSAPDVLEKRWKLGRNHWRTAPHYPALRLLGLLLEGRIETIIRLQTRLGVTPNTFAKTKSRLKEGLAELIQTPKDQIYVRPGTISPY